MVQSYFSDMALSASKILDVLIETVQQAFHNNVDELSYAGWQLQRIYGGMNGIIYRCANSEVSDTDWVVKIRKRDSRRRAWREFMALTALQRNHKTIAPHPIALYEGIEALPGDVVISTWIEGIRLDNLTDTPRSTWHAILNTLTQCHTSQPKDAPELQSAVLPICSSEMLFQEIEWRYALLPQGQIGETTTAEMGHLIRAFKNDARFMLSSVEASHFVMCDVNPTNMVMRDGSILCVDWESSGWGDAAFDVADLLVRPNCAGVNPQERDWIRTFYAEQHQDPRLIHRITVYEQIFLLFWLIITSNGFVARPGERLPGIQFAPPEKTRQQQLYYLERIEEVMNG